MSAVSKKSRPQPLAAVKDAVDEVAEQHADEGGGQRREQQIPKLLSRAQRHVREAAGVHGEHSEQGARVQHDAEEKSAPFRAEQPLEQQQVPAGRYGQKFRQPLHGAEDRRLPPLHILPPALSFSSLYAASG